MMESATFWLRVAVCLYAVGLLHSILTAARQGDGTFGVAMGAFRMGMILHGVGIVDLTLGAGRIPVDNFSQTLSLLAFVTALAYVILERRYRFASASVGLFPLVFGMTLVAALQQDTFPMADQGMRNVWLIVHIVVVVAAYVALLFTAVAAVGYLIQERRLKNKQTSALLERLPPLATLDTMLNKSLGLGFAFLTLGLVFGIMWAFFYADSNWIANPDVTVALVTWGLLLLMMFLRASAGWRGRKAALMSLAVLGCSAITWITHQGLGDSLLR